MEQIKVIIADDHTLFINGLQMLLKEEPGIDVIAVANDGKALLNLMILQEPDLVLLDINMPNMNGLEALKHIRHDFPAVKTIILSTYHEDHLIEKARQYGANGYLLKNCNKEELFKTLSLVLSGNSCFPYRLPKPDNSFDHPDSFLRQFNLTRRENEIIVLIQEGMTNQQMAAQLFLSIFTVETHRKNIMQKLNLKSPSALIRFLMEKR